MRMDLGLGSQPAGSRAAINLASAVAAYIPETLHNDGNGLVDSWPNSGSGGTVWDATQPIAGKRLAYSATGNRNGGPAAIGDGTASFLISSAITANQPITVFAIAKSTDGALAARRICDGRGVNTRAIYQNGVNSFVYGGAALALSGYAANTWYAFAGVFNGTSGIGRRGSVVATGDIGNVAASGICIGCAGTAEVQFWQGPIERLYLWTRAFSDAELLELEAFFGLT